MGTQCSDHSARDGNFIDKIKKSDRVMNAIKGQHDVYSAYRANKKDRWEKKTL